MAKTKTHYEQVSLEKVKAALKKYDSKQAEPWTCARAHQARKNRNSRLRNVSEEESRRMVAPGMDSGEQHFQYPEWQKLFQMALLELDDAKLPTRVAEAEAAILNRLETLSRTSNHHEERRAIQDALISLRVLKRDASRSPDAG